MWRTSWHLEVHVRESRLSACRRGTGLQQQQGDECVPVGGICLGVPASLRAPQRRLLQATSVTIGPLRGKEGRNEFHLATDLSAFPDPRQRSLLTIQGSCIRSAITPRSLGSLPSTHSPVRPFSLSLHKQGFD